MKITDILIEVVRRELADVGLDSDLGRFGGTSDQGVLRVLTDEGIEGNCIVGEFRRGGHEHFRPILEVLKPELMGRDAFDREWLWDRLGILGRRRGLTMAAWAPVDVALWDLAGKAAGVPVYKLLGTQRQHVRAYGTYPPRHEAADGYVQEAEGIKSAGFTAYKIHPGAMSRDDVIAMVGQVRKTVGDEMRLMLDPNNGYRFQQALEIGRALDANGFHWYEDPPCPGTTWTPSSS